MRRPGASGAIPLGSAVLPTVARPGGPAHEREHRRRGERVVDGGHQHHPGGVAVEQARLPGDRGDQHEERAARESTREAQRNRLVGALRVARDATRESDRQVAVLSARQEEVTEGIADLERRLATAHERLAKVTAELDRATAERNRRENAESSAEARKPAASATTGLSMREVGSTSVVGATVSVHGLPTRGAIGSLCASRFSWRASPDSARR